MTAKIQPLSARQYDTALDVLHAFDALAVSLRGAGWKVNFAIETGSAEAVNFSAQRDKPQGEAP